MHRLVHVLVGHGAEVLHLDWSVNGRHLQSCCSRSELHFWDTYEGVRVSDRGTVRDVRWASWTLPLGWPVLGVLPKMSDGSDINAAHRSPDGRLVATVDDFRKLNLFHFPCGPGSAACRSAAAHASHVSGVRFTADGRHLLTAGGPDLCVIVWRVE
uniref:EML-like second beta-propeller domain-containing protein n=1 Tax=Coccolithus braarudii TaxID=221442 RepID=A0A7S0L1W1_9EUKA